MAEVNSSMAAIEWNRAPIWESAFKIAEAPMSYLNKLQNRHGDGSCFTKFFSESPTSFAGHGDQLLDGFRYRRVDIIKDSLVGFGSDVKKSFIYLYEKKHLVAIVLATGIAFPTTVALTPVSIIADIFAGVIQASLRLCQRADKDEILLILHKKVIASPVQQGVYLLTSVIALGSLASGSSLRMYVAGFALVPAFAVNTFVMSAMMGNLLYCVNQQLVASLPRFFRPEGYNVFIEGGAEDHLGRKADFNAEETYQRWRQGRSKSEGANTTGFYDTASDEFAQFRTQTQKDLGELKVNCSEKFQRFRNWLNSDEPTSYALFEFSSEKEVTEEELKKKYRSLSRLCHPDKCQDNEKKEAEIWFKLLNEARCDVEKNILEM